VLTSRVYHGEVTLHVLVDTFSIFGVEIQYWMLIAALIVAAGVAYAMLMN
jgi:hypothetical protein